MASFESIIDSISDSSKKNFKGQVSMFDLGGGMGEEDTKEELEKMKYSYTTLKEYTEKELLSMEKEMLGLYISGHPLEGIRNQIEVHTNISTLRIREGLDELEQTGNFPYKDGQTVKFAGIINSIKKKYTKNNKIMAFVTIEDLHGSIEVIVFENCYQTSTDALLEDNIVMVEGRLSIREEEENVSIIASKIYNFDTPGDALNTPLGTFPNGESVPFGTPQMNNARKILSINITNLTEDQKERLRGAIKFFIGDRNNTQLEIINGEKTIPSGGIFMNEEIFKEFEEIVGSENCKLHN